MGHWHVAGILLLAVVGQTQVVEHVRMNEVNVPERAGGRVVNLSRRGYGWGDEIVWEPERPLVSCFHEEVKFEITSDKTRTLEVILYVANHLEEDIWISVKSDNEEHHRPDPHIITDASCFDFTDECRQQTNFQYTLPPFVSPHTKFQSRIALRVQARFPTTSSLSGNWIVRISNKLPGDRDNARVKLVVVQRSYGYWDGVAVGGLVSIFGVVAVLMMWSCVRRISARERSEGGEDDAEPPVSLLTRVRTAVRGVLDSKRYSKMKEKTDDEGSLEEGEEDDEVVCRICRCTQPEGDLFSPCECKGSVKWVHRACLEEWREKTTNHENKKKCSECKAAFTIAVTHTNKRWDFTKAVYKAGGTLLLWIVLMECALIGLGYVFKISIGLLTFDIENVKWEIDTYHHLVAMAIILAYAFHAKTLTTTLETLIPSAYAPFRHIVIIGSLLFEVLTGYLGHFILWCLNTTIWEWQVHYCTGLGVVVLYRLFIHDAIIRWKHQYTARRRRPAPVAVAAPPVVVEEEPVPANENAEHRDEQSTPPAPMLTHTRSPLSPPPPLTAPSLD